MWPKWSKSTVFIPQHWADVRMKREERETRREGGKKTRREDEEGRQKDNNTRKMKGSWIQGDWNLTMALTPTHGETTPHNLFQNLGVPELSHRLGNHRVCCLISKTSCGQCLLHSSRNTFWILENVVRSMKAMVPGRYDNELLRVFAHHCFWNPIPFS